MNLSNHGKEQFLNEVKLIRSLQHRNLVRIIGCCVEGEDDSMFLVYEYVSNQSLHKHLFGNVIFIVYYFYMILSKYNVILFPLLFFLSLALLFSLLITWFHISWDTFSLCHWLHFDSDILMSALYSFIYYCERAHLYVDGVCLSCTQYICLKV